MPGRIFAERATDFYRQHLGASGTDCDVAQGLDIAPGQMIAVVDANMTMVAMRWGMILSGRVNARKRPVMETIVNARSETVFKKSAFEGVLPALVPCDGWYEWTGEKRRKTRWRIRRKDGAPIVFAAIYDVWNGPGGVKLPQVATLTCEPNADVKDIHHRMGVIVPPDLWRPWLAGQPIPMTPAPDGSLVVSQVDDME